MQGASDIKVFFKLRLNDKAFQSALFYYGFVST